MNCFFYAYMYAQVHVSASLMPTWSALACSFYAYMHAYMYAYTCICIGGHNCMNETHLVSLGLFFTRGRSHTRLLPLHLLKLSPYDPFLLRQHPTHAPPPGRGLRAQHARLRRLNGTQHAHCPIKPHARCMQY